MNKTTRCRSILTHDVGLGVDGCRLRGSGQPLQGLKGHLDDLKIVLQPAHLTGGVRVAFASLVCLRMSSRNSRRSFEEDNDELDPLLTLINSNF
jgi:hypothetical protein